MADPDRTREAMPMIPSFDAAERVAFHRGVLWTLAHIADADEQTLYEEIVAAVGIVPLLAALEPSCRAEDAAFFGLVRYGYTDKLGRARKGQR